MEKKYYIDSNVFIFAYCYDNKDGDYCRNIIKKIINNEIQAFTSSLTFDELFYKTFKLKDRKTALLVADLFLNLKNINFISVDYNIMCLTNSLLIKHSIGPRDAIHLACCLNNKINIIISTDKDFDEIKEVKRINPLV